VAALSGDLLAHELNLEDSQMSILHGHFTVVLIVAGADTTDLAGLRADLERTAERLSLEALSLSELGDGEGEATGEATESGKRPSSSEPTCIVTVYGADHPGIVHAVASALAESAVNITDLQTRLGSGHEGSELYAMMLEVALPAGFSEADLEILFEGVRREQGVQATVRALEQDVL